MSKFILTQTNSKLFSLSGANVKSFRLTPSVMWFEWVKSLMSFLWVGNIDNNKLLSRIDDRYATITGKDFTGSIIPSTSVAAFTLPTDADFIADDLDGCWFTAGVQNDLTVADLIGTDWARTLVLYPDSAPYNISAIALLKSTSVLTDVEREQLAADFKLWILWSEII